MQAYAKCILFASDFQPNRTIAGKPETKVRKSCLEVLEAGSLIDLLLFLTFVRPLPPCKSTPPPPSAPRPLASAVSGGGGAYAYNENP